MTIEQPDLLAKYRNDPRWAKEQLEYLEAQILLQAAEDCAKEDYMEWDGRDETLQEVARQHSRIDQQYCVPVAREWFLHCRRRLLNWSKQIVVKLAEQDGRSKARIEQMMHLHDHAEEHPHILDQLIETALSLNAASIPTE